MAHYRQTIRDAVAAVLSGNTAAGANVFTSRARPVLEILQRRESVLSVYTSDESSELQGDGYTLQRSLQVSIEGMAGGGDDLDDVLDALAQEVEELIDADPMLGNLLSSEMVLVGTTSEIGAKGNQQVGAFRLDYECAYKTTRQTENYLPGDNPGDWIQVPPIPTTIVVNPKPTPIAYVDPVGSIENDDDEVRALETDVVLAPAGPVATTDSVCTKDGCEIPAYHGDKTDAGYAPPPVPPEPEP